MNRVTDEREHFQDEKDVNKAKLRQDVWQPLATTLHHTRSSPKIIEHPVESPVEEIDL